MNGLLQSRQFWTAVVAAVATLAVYFVGKYAFSALEDVQMVLNILLPIVGLFIIAYTVDDAVKTHARAMVEVEQTRLANTQAMAQVESMRLESVRLQATKVE